MLRINELLEQRVPAGPLGIARIVLGLAAVLKGVVTAASVNAYQNENVLRFPYTSLELSTPAGTFATAISLFWIIFALFFMVGFGSRVSGAFLSVMIFLVIGIDQQFYSNHLYLMGTLVALMTIADAGRSYSIDARRSGANEPATVPRWAATLIMLQLTSVYLFAALTKVNEGFLSGAVMESAFEPSMLERVERLMPLTALAPLAVTTELFLAFAFWHQRTRFMALPVALGFHALNVVIMGRGGAFNLSIFALVMLSMMLVFFTRESATVQSVQKDERPAGGAGRPTELVMQHGESG